MKTSKNSVQRAAVAVLLLAAAGVVAACGGSPAGPSDAQGVTVRGAVVASSFSASSSSRATSAAAVLTVELLTNPAIKTEVDANGTFTLRGLPEGEFTLVFRLDGVEVGTLTFDEVLPNQEITLTVSVTSSGVQVLEERRNGIGHGDIEIEGKVDTVVSVSETADSRFVIAGRTVVARPGQTAIREGNRARTVLEVLANQQVHVKGVWLDPAPGSTTQEVLALEIKLQGDVDDDDVPTAACMINGGKVGQGIELEGNVQSGSSSSFQLKVNGNRASGLVTVNAGGATFDCKGGGPNAPTDAQCKASVTGGAKVHVRGSLDSCSTSAATVTANVVRVQK